MTKNTLLTTLFDFELYWSQHPVPVGSIVAGRETLLIRREKEERDEKYLENFSQNQSEIGKNLAQPMLYFRLSLA